jgi:hypothetical protein
MELRMISAISIDSPACEIQLFDASIGTQTRIDRHQPCNRDNIEHSLINFFGIINRLRLYISALESTAALRTTLRYRCCTNSTQYGFKRAPRS